MIKSDHINELAAALAKAQADIKAASKDAKNPFLNSRYADLGSIIDVIKEPLSKNGIAVIQLPFTLEDRIGIETVFAHSSGQFISTDMSLPLESEKGLSVAQVAGKLVSYIRRYMLSSMAGVYSEEDGDGHSNGNGNGKGLITTSAKMPLSKQKGPVEKQELATRSEPEYVPVETAAADPARPYAPAIVKQGIHKKSVNYVPFTPNAAQQNLLRHGLELLFIADDDFEVKRHAVLKFLTGTESTKEVTGPLFKAIVNDWLKMNKDATGEYLIDGMAIREAHLIWVEHLDAQAEAELVAAKV